MTYHIRLAWRPTPTGAVTSRGSRSVDLMHTPQGWQWNGFDRDPLTLGARHDLPEGQRRSGARLANDSITGGPHEGYEDALAEAERWLFHEHPAAT